MSPFAKNVNQELVASAIALAQMGFRVFPLVPEGKTPSVKEFYTSATSDTARIEAIWRDPVTAEFRPNNIGILCGEGFFVLDVDTKNDAGGLGSLEFLKDIGLDTNTLTASTPSGGQHLFYKIPSDVYVGNSAGRLGPGLDIRGWHGFVVGAGSATHVGAYAWINESPIADAPHFLIEMIRRAKPAAKTDKAALVELDTDDAVSRALFYLCNEAPEAYAGNRSDTLFRVAARVIDFGISKETGFELILEQWNEFKCDPPLEMGELLQTVENAWNYRSKPPGVSNPAADFDAVMQEEDIGKHPDIKAAEARKARIYWQRLDEAQVEANRAYLVKGLLDLGTMAITYGESNSGKTNVVLDRALHIATGREYNGRKVKQGVTLYIAAEGGIGVRRRLQAWCMKHGIKEPAAVPFALVPCPIDMLRSGEDTKRLLEIVKEVEAAYFQKVAYIVVDTLSRAVNGGEENSSETMGTFVKYCDALRLGSGATVDVIHHSGKSKAAGARGHSLLRAAADSEFEVEPGLVRVTKQRDMAFSEEEHFKLDIVKLGQDQDGDPITSVTVRFVAKEFFEVELTEAEKKTARWLLEMAEGLAENSQLPLEENIIRTKDAVDFLARKIDVKGGQKTAVSRTYVNQLLAGLAEKGCVKKVERGQWVIVIDAIDAIDSKNEDN